MQASILLASDIESLSHPRAQWLKQWNIAIVTPAVAHSALTTEGYDLVIICQSVRETAAAEVAALATERWPNTRVMVINGHGERRNFESAQFVVDLLHPQWLPDAVSRILAAEAS